MFALNRAQWNPERQKCAAADRDKHGVLVPRRSFTAWSFEIRLITQQPDLAGAQQVSGQLSWFSFQ